jgi:uncharacterized protein YbjT (DUF2867 family)
MARVIIVGGHGKVALPLARILTERGDQVSSVFRNPDHSDEVAQTGAAPVVADIEQLDVPALAELLSGHDAVAFAAGAGGGNPARTYAVDRDAAIRVIDATARAAKAAADAHLRASDLNWTVLGPGRLTLEPATGRVGVGEAKGQVSRADVALVIAAALADDSTIRRTIDFNNGDTPIADALAG